MPIFASLIRLGIVVCLLQWRGRKIIIMIIGFRVGTDVVTKGRALNVFFTLVGNGFSPLWPRLGQSKFHGYIRTSFKRSLVLTQGAFSFAFLSKYGKFTSLNKNVEDKSYVNHFR